MVKAQGQPPGPKGKPLIGSLFDFRRDMTGFFTRIAQQYGDIAYFKLGPQKCFLLNQPDLIKDVLVTQNRNFTKSRGLERARLFLGEGLLTSEGDFHLRQRRMMQPSFHRKRVADFARVMVERTLRIIERWEHGSEMDLSKEMMRLTLGIAGETLFDVDVESEADEIGQALTQILELFPLILLPFSELFDRIPLPANRRFRKGRERIDNIIFRLIEERRKSGMDRGDLLSMLVHALDEEGDGKGMSNEQVRDEIMTLLLAGHETTALGLTWTWYLLSQNPEAEERMQQELSSVLGGRAPDLDDVDRLVYTRMVFAEAMRIYPPAWVVGRRAKENCVMGDCPIPAGAILFMSQFVMHRDPRYFPDPLRFDPDRWIPQEAARRPHFSYFPFGGGPRVCIGETFAWMEGVLVLATIAQKWKLQLVPGHPVVPKALITLRPSYGMRMTLQRRQGAP